MHHFKVLEDYLLFPILLLQVTNADQEAGIKDNKKYFLQRGEIKNYNFYDQPINDLIKHYDELRKV